MTVLEEVAPTKKRRRRRRRSKKKTADVVHVAEVLETAEVQASSDDEVATEPKKKRRKRGRRDSKKTKTDVVQDEEAITEIETPIEVPAVEQSLGEGEAEPEKKRRKRRRRRSKKKLSSAEVTVTKVVEKLPVPAPQISPEALREIGLKPTWGGFIRMRGKTDNGRKWYQEIDPYLAYVLVKENAAVVVNRNTIRRLYSNKEFRRLILERDEYTCYFCKQYGDTIDHMLPRAKGGHTTPDNCVCACNLCNQSKADKDLEDFMTNLDHG